MKKLTNALKKVVAPVIVLVTLSMFTYADDLNGVKDKTLTVIQFVEGIATAIFMAGFAFKAKWHWSLSNMVEGSTDIEKHKKGFQKSILGLIGLLIMGIVIIYITNTYKS